MESVRKKQAQPSQLMASPEAGASGVQFAPPPFQLQASSPGETASPVAVGAAHDPAEQEADQKALEVVEGGQSADNALEEAPQLSEEDGEVLKMLEASPEMAQLLEQEMGLPSDLPASEAQETQETVHVQRKSSSDAPAAASAGFQSTLQAKSGGGEKLSAGTQNEMGAKLGADFSDVHVHTDADAVQMNQEIGSEAFASGNDIYFNQGNYDDQTMQGKFLLAHELTHVAQQKNAGEGEQKEVKPFLGKLWKGIKKVGKAVGKGIWEGVKYLGRVGGSLAGWLWKAITKFPQRISTLVVHLLSPVWKVPMWLWDGLKTAFTNPKGLGKWLWEGIKGGAAWTGRLITKMLDVVGFGEMMDVLFTMIKLNTRTLNGVEKSEAQKVLGGSVPYWLVRIDEASLISAIGAAFNGGGGMGVTTWHTINFNRKISASPGNSDMHWLIHELVHVAQYEAVGTQYIGEALAAQAGAGYAYGGPAGLVGKNLSDFNREQQADIIADAYQSQHNGTINADQRRMVDQAKKGQF